MNWIKNSTTTSVSRLREGRTMRYLEGAVALLVTTLLFGSSVCEAQLAQAPHSAIPARLDLPSDFKVQRTDWIDNGRQKVGWPLGDSNQITNNHAGGTAFVMDSNAAGATINLDLRDNTATGGAVDFELTKSIWASSSILISWKLMKRLPRIWSRRLPLVWFCLHRAAKVHDSFVRPILLHCHHA